MILAALALAVGLAGEPILMTMDRIVMATQDQYPLILVPVEKIADDAVKDVVWIVRSHAFDLGTTALGIRRGAREANPFGPDVESRVALKMFGSASGALTCWELRRAGKPRAASIVRWATVAMNFGFGVSNLYQAFK